MVISRYSFPSGPPRPVLHSCMGALLVVPKKIILEPHLSHGVYTGKLDGQHSQKRACLARSFFIGLAPVSRHHPSSFLITSKTKNGFAKSSTGSAGQTHFQLLLNLTSTLPFSSKQGRHAKIQGFRRTVEDRPVGSKKGTCFRGQKQLRGLDIVALMFLAPQHARFCGLAALSSVQKRKPCSVVVSI